MLRITDTSQGPGRVAGDPLLESLFATPDPDSSVPARLGTVYGIVKQHQGHTWAYSVPGHGTVIEICFPRHEESVDTASARPKPAAPIGKETVLFVEDENAVRGPVARSLRDLGYRVLEATNGPAALSAAQADAGRIDVLVTDVVMPQMNGVELARQLGATRSDLKVLLVSGYTDDDLSRYGVLDGETAFLQKPFTVQTLARKIREVLEVDQIKPLEER
jgi:CheY-like chemotaxis protein